MKSPLVFSLMALVLGSVALVSSFLDRAPVSPRSQAVPLGPSSIDSVVPRIEELAEENRDLRDRLLALEMRPAPATTARVPAEEASVTREEFDAFREEMREVLAGLSKVGSHSDGLRDQVASALTEVRQKEAMESMRAKQEARLDRLDVLLPKMEGWLELTPQQSEQMRSALVARYEREAELTRRWKAGEDPEVLGELKESDRETHQAELSGFLSPAQLERYAGSQSKGAN